MTTAKFVRDYRPLLLATGGAPFLQRAGAMRLACDLFWEAFGDANPERPLPGRGVSWIGFYGLDTSADSMTLLERRDKPACSPIGVHGACGRSALEKAPILVADIKSLGEHYIACDPRDQSELVIPMVDASGLCWGVLDADSYAIGAFSQADVEGMRSVCAALGLTAESHPAPTMHL